MRGFTLIEALVWVMIVGILAAIIAPLIANSEESKGLRDLQRYMAETSKAEQWMPSGPVNNYPFVLPKSQAESQTITINPHPMLLREQVISERLGGAGSDYNTPLGRALQGALYDAQVGRKR